ncbi:hypothetical protein N825_29590 [Skermanella stibiiresistens SB22]|uniref:Uncharacterized protein n=1 Tax=Skermanella stibiiresistens SB22 TaxID=1385369 RepID=W9GU00_9PROT|nr:hypothetical protein N825_29590 [Skermanella stibiiresistens SB22]
MWEGVLRVGIGLAHLVARPLCHEHPGDVGVGVITLSLSGGDLCFGAFALGDAAVQAL